MGKKRYAIELKRMEFFANHGCFEQEQIIGNKFMVDLLVNVDCSEAETSDQIDKALNYTELYNIIKEQMAITSHLLENVAGRIIDKIVAKFPQIDQAKIVIDKLNPPLGGQLYASSVTITYTKEN